MLRDDATRAKQEGVGAVEEAGFRAGAERAECGGVLPRTQAVCATFFAWKKRLREAATPRQPQGGEAAQFVEVKLMAASTAGESRVEVRLQNGRSLLVGPGFDAEHLRVWLAVVEGGA